MAQIDIESPMTGAIHDVLVAPGDTVSEGQEIIILDSMKMEIPVESPAAGTITEVAVSKGDPIETGRLLARLETA